MRERLARAMEEEDRSLTVAAPGSKVVSAFRFLDLLGDVAAFRTPCPPPAPRGETPSNILLWFPPGFHELTIFPNFAKQ